MKFLCDRCKTRYSIADDRVRGKILKIRCKNCANVITVREGMEQPVEVNTPVPTPQPQRTAQRAAIAPGAGVGGRPLEAAFATAMSSPGITVPPAAPAALEEEWYVSIDGNQQGPFSLAQAQGWVRARGGDDELYCWSEGFDDWLPVEKVSHFRGLRGRVRAATMPPPVPTDSGRHLKIDQSEPKPLFAATLAALEQDAPTSIGSPPIKLEDLMPRAVPRVDPAAASKATSGANNGRATGSRGLPAPGVPARTRDGAPPLPGSGSLKAPTGPSMPMAASPSGGVPAAGPARSSTPATPSFDSPGLRPGVAQDARGMFGKGAAPAPAPTSGKGANGANGHDPGASASATQPMFDSAGGDDGAVESSMPDAMSAGASRAPSHDDDLENDDLAIGEVSRVVRLEDIARQSAPAIAPRRTPQAAAVARGTGAVAKFDAATLAASGDGLPPMAMAIPPPLTGTESEIVQQLAQPPRAPGHRMLIIAGIGLVAVLATLVVVFATRGGDDDEDGQGPRLISGDEDLAGISMEVAVTVLPTPVETGSGSTGTNPPTNGSGSKPPTNGGHRPTNNGNGTNGNGTNGNGKIEPDRSGMAPLSGEDVYAMSQKMSTGPRRCYEQAKRKDPFLDVKKLRAVITVDKAGTVTKVELLDHSNQQLDGCLSSAVGRWRFRENSEGLTSQVSFAFMSG